VKGLRYRKHLKIGDARPDVCFIGKRLAIFVDGCFWHGCPEHFTPPKSNTQYWERRIERNQGRDRRNDTQLETEGWTVRRYWECEVEADIESIVQEIGDLIRQAAR
jgi:DNA mismatch endonuclease (patch repair protein)